MRAGLTRLQALKAMRPTAEEDEQTLAAGKLSSAQRNAILMRYIDLSAVIEVRSSNVQCVQAQPTSVR